MVLVRIAAAIAAVTQLPALSSVTQGNNAKFLPASAPSQHVADLATPFGTANLAATPVVAACSGSALTTADLAALSGTSAPGRHACPPPLDALYGGSCPD